MEQSRGKEGYLYSTLGVSGKMSGKERRKEKTGMVCGKVAVTQTFIMSLL